MLRKSKSRKRVIRYGLLSLNVLVLVIVIAFVISNPAGSNAVKQNISNSSTNIATNPLDQLSSADIAAHVALMTRMDEMVSVTNQADSVNAQLNFVQATTTVVNKPQVIASGLKSRKDIQKYIVQPGDTVGSLANKFGITSETIKWSNTLTSDTLTVGQELIISPVNGIVYKVKAGDTVDGLASKYSASRDLLVAFNDAEVGGLPVNQYIVIPDGRPQAAPLRLLFGGGGYDAGWCTSYAAAKAGVPGGWGNANTWHLYAPLYGWTVSATPRVGAVAQTTAGWAGHVGVVEAVSADGTMIKYSDMNGLAGFNKVGYSDWVPVIGKYQRFIYH